MSRILHIEASPRGELSASSQLATWFLDANRKAHADDEVQVLNVFDADLPPVGRDAAEAKFAPLYGQAMTDAQAAVWKQVRARISELDAVDKLVISSPMWNFSIPYALKHYLDIIIQPLLTFSMDPKTGQHIGLLRDRPVQLFLTRSSTAPDDAGDFQLPYLRHALGFIGLSDVRALTAWQTTQPTPEARAAYIAEFRSECERLGAQF
jgi:FMN-dependent NADH-azoreductase